ncbi:GAP1-N2 domain-containing protein [Phytomonospora endophytica]|uniref:Uncharacterized protein n=1 Tax=Phytomonospora endophytica TaxID=714109 RepID=A0A841FWJ6_9ACTN|nr:GTPase-associated protein 1-related protein [Phytomonospora endophytica]MBB6036859.1 hypothetical protein [Phytomonospora endophytica]GIG68107.1 hypothetical protein Pen01_44020 [Phytomonospora endophytica]
MTGRLEALIYTDCLPGESLSGSAGLGFQAASPGAEPEARELTRNHLLYEPPAEWMRDRRPVAEYPASLAHIHANGWYATAAGTYLGKEAKGNRQGNHVTHAAVTRDAAAYDLIRPAQLAGADFWRTGPVPGGRAPVIGPNWSPGELDTDTVAALVRERPGGRELLTGLLSALTGDERRIVLVGADPREILAWIAAATLLLPQQRALDVGFKVYTTRPSHGAHRIVGVHPDWLPGDLEGMHVFDLRDEPPSDTATDEIAAGWAGLLHAEDALDVVDAVELAALSGLDPGAGQALAAAAFFGLTPPSLHATALATWLRECDDDRYRAYGSGVATALLALPDRPRPLLAALDTLASAGRLGEHAPEIRIALLEEECREAAAGAVEAGALPPLPSGTWLPEHRDRAEAVLADAFTTVSVQRFRLLLAVADRFGLRPDLIGELATATDAFIDWWADNPGTSPEPSSHHSGELLRDRLLDNLRERCGEGADDREAHRVGEHWAEVVFAWTGGPPDWDDPLIRACLGARGRHASPEEFAALARTRLKDGDPVEAEFRIGVLSRWRRPRFGDLTHLATVLPRGTRLPESFAEAARTEVFAPGPLTDEVVQTVTKLLALGLLNDPRLKEITEADALLAELRVPKDRESIDAAEDFLLDVHDLDHRILKRHGDVVVATLLGRRMPRVVATVLEALRAADRDDFADQLTTRLKSRAASSYTLFCAFTVLTKGLATPQAGPRLDAACGRALRAADDAVLRRVEAIADGFSATWRARWIEFAASRSVKPGPLQRMWSDRFRKGG